ncbi:3-isopropylmalate dehydratase, small subunit [Schinkia azotoformans MEV2011]|uniref:3-isopropylmalate dehydratase small subunit n=2 Tax=Schinkia azotoformans TaxID=1454 RepID=K6DQU6_SCHAZ|nr:3-isopropylmalate dehydratase small subunit [Schinkia azotoformans]EKN70573.1 isopropylmalate isomerase small subunit [Schinkia azotoformans LMG 9581]KEF39508.1 3-isopropylmalate dehydratase, small subunit [Schinkia azotoformans MEV2011]MEC1637803.1 3-isopropylmalate dehydratase small subunit [Schinkia azotoformans]MEC1694199.1 3-isopropylmalate dehydratase small subunit [Schinkia azotoformans]MEC1715014.1 3-isopropylmalate dehydratase small subunit [Schinkia azotoformans]
MEPIVIHTGKVAGLDRVNVDTDQIIPKQFLKRIERTGFGKFLFNDWRYNNDGTENESFELNRPENKGASILVAGHNFGCGSSREHAPWALNDYGFQVVIAPSFADIFYNNCLKNGMLPIRLEESIVKDLLAKSIAADFELTVDLKNQVIVDGDQKYTFEIDPYWKEMLINGWDEIDVTLKYDEAIASYEAK